jgi:hypothetical protein
MQHVKIPIIRPIAAYLLDLSLNSPAVQMIIDRPGAIIITIPARNP